MPISALLERMRSSASTSMDVRSSSEVVPPHTNTRQQASMECSFEVVAEIVPCSPGSASGSLCSSVAADEPAAGAVRVPQQQQQPRQPSDNYGLSRSQPAVMQVTRAASLNSGPLPSVSGLAPTTTRALRARGKAMLRTESGLPSMEHAHSLDSNGSSTMELAASLWGGAVGAAPGSLAAAAAAGGALQLQSPSGACNKPSAAAAPASAPLPAPAFAQQDGLLAAGGSSAATPAVAVAVAAAAGGLQQLQHVEDDEHDDDEGDDDMLVHPMSPSAAMAEDEEHDAAAHCHWEDGVVATWLQDIDHSELLHAAGEHAAADAKAGSAIYSSLLYT